MESAHDEVLGFIETKITQRKVNIPFARKFIYTLYIRTHVWKFFRTYLQHQRRHILEHQWRNLNSD
jgi:hypothetical protein